MVEPTVLAIGAVAFFVVLILILRNATREEPIQKVAKKDKQKQKQLQSKQQKAKKGRSALKKNERAGISSEWQVVGDSTARDAHEVLEFLKGKDPSEIAKQQAATTKQPAKKKAKKAKEEVQSSEDSATDDGGALEGFEEVKKKAPTEKKKKKKEKKTEEVKDQSKPYFRALNPDGTPVKDEKQKKGRKGRNSGDEAQGERKPKEPRPEGEKRERKPKPEGEKQREPRERKEGDEPRGERKPREPREPRPPREPREERRPVTSPPNVKVYEEADLNELLNAITKDYKPKTKITRYDSQFSPIPRQLILRILGKLEARDLVALSRVNHYFLGVSRNVDLWKALCLRDFGLKDPGKKSWRLAYIAEFQKRRKRRSKKEEAAVPQGEEKDTKGKQKPSKEEEVTQE